MARSFEDIQAGSAEDTRPAERGELAVVAQAVAAMMEAVHADRREQIAAASGGWHDAATRALRGERDELKEARDRLQEECLALVGYAQHKEWCATRKMFPGPPEQVGADMRPGQCDCGLGLLLDRLRMHESPKYALQEIIDRMRIARDGWQARAEDLAEALDLTQQYIGDNLLPRQRGWSWFDALNRWRVANGGDMLEEKRSPETREAAPRA